MAITHQKDTKHQSDEAGGGKASGTNTRPMLHFTAPFWINDPCAPGYDPATGLYHLFYQCNPYGCEWGNMAWGHITSPDLLTWNRTSDKPALSPDETYDKEGVFTGCFGPPTDSTQLTVFYSSVQKMPFHWSTPPYPRNAAGLSMATSNDNGRTWTKSRNNPILKGEPEGVNVSGFRDPFFSEWRELDRVRGEHALYGVVSGGIQDAGPTIFLYAVNPKCAEEWEYLGPFVDMPLRYQPSPKWSGNFGVNWECVNFMTLKSGCTSRNFLIVGAEGDMERDHIQHQTLPPTVHPRTVRGQLWMSGQLKQKGGRVKFVQGNCGIFDHGCYYAASLFIDPKSQRRIVHGWIPEEDCTLAYARRKGWNGSLAIPREVFLLCMEGVVRGYRSPLAAISCVEVIEKENRSATLLTMGIRPISEIDQTRRNCLRAHTCHQLTLPQPKSQQYWLCSTDTSAWELEATISISEQCEAVGFYIRHNNDLTIRTTISFYPLDETIAVERGSSTPDAEVNKCSEKGPFTLFETIGSGQADSTCLEKLHLRIFSDGDILEVFANDRFALATMVYSGSCGVNNGLTAYATGAQGCAMFESISVWDGLNNMKSLIVGPEEN